MAGTKTTSGDLVNELTAINVNGRYDKIIERAKNNGYHDFKFDQNPDHPEYANCACPITQLVADLSFFPELKDLRQRVIQGEFDETPDEADKQMMRNWLKEDGEEGDALAKIIGL